MKKKPPFRGGFFHHPILWRHSGILNVWFLKNRSNPPFADPSETPDSCPTTFGVAPCELYIGLLLAGPELACIFFGLANDSITLIVFPFWKFSQIGYSVTESLITRTISIGFRFLTTFVLMYFWYRFWSLTLFCLLLYDFSLEMIARSLLVSSLLLMNWFNCFKVPFWSEVQVS